MRSRGSGPVVMVVAVVLAAGLSGCWSGNGGAGPGALSGASADMGLTTQVGSTAVRQAADRLSPAEKSTLQFMVEEEKLAHDVYVVLGRRYDLPIFDNIAESETRHREAVAGLLDAYGVADPTDDTRRGEFVDPTLQALYDRLVAQGRRSLAKALSVGVLIERTDIADLRAAIEESTHADVDRVYASLLAGSRNHLAAFLRVG